MKAVTEKLCNKCKVVKPASDFSTCRGYLRWLCKECDRAYQREQHITNRDRDNAKRKAWGEAHPEKIKEWRNREYRKNKEKYDALKRKWNEDHPEAVKLYRKAYYEANREQILANQKEYHREYYRKNRERILLYHRNRRMALATTVV